MYTDKALSEKDRMQIIPGNIKNPMRQMLRKIRRNIRARRGETPSPEPAQPSPEKAAWERLRAAGYPPAILDDLPNVGPEAYNTAQAIQQGGYLVNVVSGVSGTGKTSIAALLALWRAQRGQRIGQYQSAFNLAQSVNRTNHPSDIAKAQNAARKSAWLVLDDIGQAPLWAADEIEALIVERQEHYLPTLIIGKPGAVKRLGDQIKTRARITELTWPAFR